MPRRETLPNVEVVKPTQRSKEIKMQARKVLNLRAKLLGISTAAVIAGLIAAAPVAASSTRYSPDYRASTTYTVGENHSYGTLRTQALSGSCAAVKMLGWNWALQSYGKWHTVKSTCSSYQSIGWDDWSYVYVDRVWIAICTATCSVVEAK
jgi:hypothetical protein